MNPLVLGAALAPVDHQQYLLEARQMQAMSFAVHIPLVAFAILHRIAKYKTAKRLGGVRLLRAFSIGSRHRPLANGANRLAQHSGTHRCAPFLLTDFRLSLRRNCQQDWSSGKTRIITRLAEVCIILHSVHDLQEIDVAVRTNSVKSAE